MTDHRIVPLDQSKYESAREAMALAFFDDPISDFLAPDRSKRHKALVWMFGSMIKYGMRWGVVDTDENGKSAAVWLPPGQTKMPLRRIVRTPLIQFPFRLGLRGTLRFGAAMGAMDKAHTRVMPEPHWYLAGIGVHPDLQGTGVGSALMNRGFERADAENRRIYLETGTDEDIAFYSKRDFEEKDTMMIKDLRATLMVRPEQG